MSKLQNSAVALMPNSAAEVKILARRAEKLAYEPNKKLDEATLIYLQFQLNEQVTYGIDQTVLDAVIDVEGLTALNWLPSFIAGVIAWKGLILTVLETNFLCSESVITESPEKKIIIISYQDKKLGLLVNAIDGFMEYSESHVATSVQSPIKFNTAYFQGLLNDSVILLNTFELLTDSSLEIR